MGFVIEQDIANTYQDRYMYHIIPVHCVLCSARTQNGEQTIEDIHQDRYMYHIIPIDYREYLSRPICVSYKSDRLSRIPIKTDICII